MAFRKRSSTPPLQPKQNPRELGPTSSRTYMKPKIGILHKTKAIDYNVYYNGQDVTPKPLNQQVFKAGKERQLNVVNMSTGDTGSTKMDVSSSQFQRSVSAGRFKTDLNTMDMNRSLHVSNLEDTFFLQSIMTDTNTESERLLADSEIKSDFEDKPSMPMPIPDQISLVLNETDTFFILDIPSTSEIKGSEEGDSVETANEHYEYLTLGKGKNRKVIEAMVQTHGTLKKSRETEAIRVKTTSNSTFASNWEMHDTFNEELSETKKTDLKVASVEDNLHGLNEAISIESFRQSLEEKQLYNLMKNDYFLQAATVVERLLANNTYNVQQKRFKGLYEADVFRENIEYKYELELLWTFANHQTHGQPVTVINWNPSNEDIIAVGHGKFYATDHTAGMVMIWNIKNPVQPERVYQYKESVTALAFSNVQPYLIAVGFSTGLILVVDIRERDSNIFHQSGMSSDAASYESVNYVTFYSGDEHYNYEEQILACFNDGRVCKYRLNLMTVMPSIQIMRAPLADGKIKGVADLISCSRHSIPLSKYTGAVSITFHPVDPNLYYISTNTGVIFKCSTNYFNQHLDLHLTHIGPLYQMHFSPFCNKLYVTCGGDWNIRIWAEGIYEPLIELFTKMYPVECVLWSPTHSTILVAIQSTQIQIWDLHRKVHYPQNIILSPTGARNSAISFTKNGKCLTVSDIHGNTHIYSIENMPIPPFFQDHLLYSAIRRNLITRPELLKKFTGLKGMNYEKASR